MAVNEPTEENTTRTKTFKTRIKQRRDTSANWESKNPVLLNGEVIIVDTANGETRTKTGDGTKTYTQLPFDDEGAKGGKSLIDKSFADKVSTSSNTTTIDNQLKTYSITTRLEADVAITGLDENGQEVIKHKLSEKANSSEVNNKVDKVPGKSLIDENVSKQVVYNPNDNYVHVDYKYTKGSGLDCSGIKIQRLSREDETSDYEASETIPYTELSGATVKLKTPDNEASVELSTTGFTIDNNKEQSSPSILLRTKAGDIIVHNYTTNEEHCLSEKVNKSDVLTKTNTTEFTPTADYQPATKKYVDGNKLSDIANGEPIGTVKIGRTGALLTEGPYSTAIGFGGHTSADALGSIAMCGGECLASFTVAMGNCTVASGTDQFVQGKYNVKDTGSKYVHIIGNGTSDTARSNAHTVDWNGNAWFAGDVEGVKDGTTHKLSEKANVDDVITTDSSANMGINGELIFPHPAFGSTTSNCVTISGDDGLVLNFPSINNIGEGIRPDITLVAGTTTHKLSEKANTSDLAKKIGTGENYNPNASAANVINLSGLTKAQYDSGEYTEGSNVAERISGIRFDTGTTTNKAQITIGSDSGGVNTVVCSRDSIVGMQNGYEIFGISVNDIWCGDTTYSTMPGEVHYLKKKWEGKTYTISVPITDWTEKTDSENQKYYYKKITVSNMTAYGQAMTDVAMSDDVATARKQMEAYQCINRVVTGEGYVELYCFDEIPTTAFTLRVLVIGNWLG